jgi:hypothetical protein
MIRKLWGNSYYDKSENEWQIKPISDKGEQIKRVFNEFILDPIIKIRHAIMNGAKD